MSTGGIPEPVFPCIPNLGAHLPNYLQPTVRELKCCKPNGNQLYSLGYAGIQVADYLLTGIGPTGGAFTEAFQEAQYWFARPAIFLVLPWMLMFIAIFIYMGFTGLMSMFAAVIFITITLLIGAATIFIVIWETRNLLLNAEGSVNNFINTSINNARAAVNERWTTNEQQIIEYLASAYKIEQSCDPTEVNACCGFNTNACVTQCTAQLAVSPTVVAPGATGHMILDIIGTATTGGFFVIPPELNGGVTGITIPFTGDNPVDFVYGAQNVETVATITAVAYCPTCPLGTDKTIVLTQNVIVTSATGTALMEEEFMVEGTESREETAASIAQLQETLQNVQLIQEQLQQRLARQKEPKEQRQQPPDRNLDQGHNRNLRPSCVGCGNNRANVRPNRFNHR